MHDAGGLGAVRQFRVTRHEGRRVFMKAVDSDAMRDYSDSLDVDAPLLCIDIYADGTILAKSGSQSACVVRVRIANVEKKSQEWIDVGIAPIVRTSTTYPDGRLSAQRAELFLRCLFLGFNDAMIASKRGFMLFGKLHYVRICTFLCDQKQ